RARRQERQELVPPLHYGHATAVEHLLDAQLHQLGEALRTVGVDVVDAHAPWILVDEHEGGTRHIGVHAQPSREPLQEAGLARAQRADAGDDVTRPETRAEPLAERPGLLGAPREEPHRETGLRAAGMAPVVSP